MKSLLYKTLLISLLAFGFSLNSNAQTARPSPVQQDEVLKIDTELVRTGFSVVDKDGKFVGGITKNQIELRIDGKPKEIESFERVKAGTAQEQALLERPGARPPESAPYTSVPARTVVFFVDDLHMSLDSLGRTRSAILRFLDEEMQPSDQVALASASGQIGFLQQLTDNKAVIRAALGRLKHIPNTVRDTESPPMSEYIAIKVEHNDGEAIDFYAEQIMKDWKTRNSVAINQHAVREMVKNRARHIVIGVESVTASMLASLENLIRTTAALPGRKLVFVISDGFYLDPRNTGSSATDTLHRVTDAAVRNGTVVYTVDARGLTSSSQADATNERPVDTRGRIDRANVGEISLSQDGLNALAGDTGGQALRNSYFFGNWMSRAVEENSNYYLITWKPDADAQKQAGYRSIEIVVAGQPSLTAKVGSRFFNGNLETKSANTAAKSLGSGKTEEKGVDADLREAIAAATPKRSLTVYASSSFVNAPDNSTLVTASAQVAAAGLKFGKDGSSPAEVDLAGVILNDKGKQSAGFKTRMAVKPMPSDAEQRSDWGVIYNYKSTLAPGIYQVRIAARDVQSGKIGTAMQWLEVPDLTSSGLTLSSLLLSEDGAISVAKTSAGAPQIQNQFSVNRRFPRSSKLNFLLLAYNTARGQSVSEMPNLTAQVKLTRDGQTIAATPERSLKLDGATDLARIPYAGSMPLSSLQPGRYWIEVKITDLRAKRSASRMLGFDVY
jgi:VWFA-related protein